MVDIAREYSKRYSRTYVGIKMGDTIKPVRIHDVSSGESRARLRWADESGDVHDVSRHNIEAKIQLQPLTLGMMEVSGSLHYLFKIPIRQYKAGYHGDNTSLTSLQGNEIRATGKRRVDKISQGVLHHIFNPTYTEFDDGMRRLERCDTMGFAINKKFGVGIKRGFINPVVFYKNIAIGELNEDKTLTLVKPFHHLYEEISQYIPSKLGE